MSIAEKKEEILKLIEQLQPSSTRAPTRQPERQPPAARPLGKRVSRRRAELAELKDMRQHTALNLLEERLLAVCHALDQRIARIEELVKRGAAAAEQRPPEPVGMEIAENLTDMQPDFGTIPSIQDARPALAGPGQAQAEPSSAMAVIEHTLAGKIEEGILTDILQFISTNDKTGVFVTHSDTGETKIYFNEGQICHCEAGGISGESAFFAAMSVEQGRFYFDETEDIPDEKTIDGNTQFLILEALRQIDESRGGE